MITHTVYQLGYRTMGSGFNPVQAKHFSLLHNVATGYGTHLASYRISTRPVSPDIKQQRHEADHSPPPVLELCFHSHIRLHGVMLN
jgi:hypothetical protein